MVGVCMYIYIVYTCLFFLGRSCTDDNPWVRLGTIMLQRCPPEEKENTGNEILKICRSLYETKHMLPVEVSFNFWYHGYESCFWVPTTRKMLPYWIKSSGELTRWLGGWSTVNAERLRELCAFCLKKRWLTILLSLNMQMRNDVGEMEPASSQRCSVIGQEAIETSYIIKTSHYIQGKPLKWWNIITAGCLEETWSLCLWRYSELDWITSWAVWSCWTQVEASWISWPLEVCSGINCSLMYL